MQLISLARTRRRKICEYDIIHVVGALLIDALDLAASLCNGQVGNVTTDSMD